MNRIRLNQQYGLTLAELLIALLIFAMLSSAGVFALRLSVDGREQLTEVDDKLREWQMARLLIKQDFAQLTPRTVRDEFGDTQAGPFVGGLAFSGRAPVAGETVLAGFVRRGWRNPDAAAPRSELQYVEYVLVGNRLVRRFRPYLDDARDQPRHERTLFSGLINAELSFLVGETTNGLQWIESWPSPGVADSGSFPRAVQLVINTERFGEVEQLFWIGDLITPSVRSSDAQ